MEQTASSSSPKDNLANASPLTNEELVWRSKYGMLESHGYHLRQRYKPDWTPSWLKSKRPAPLHEDYPAHWNSEAIDAVRIKDGRRVFLKRVADDSSELRIHRFLSEDGRLNDPWNHTIPLLDEFADDGDPTTIYMVMPLLRPYDLPEFFAVEEVVDFMRQVLEGIVFMHKSNVAHRDCSDLNIMMDADGIFPRGFHPRSTAFDSTGYRLVHPKHRRDSVPPVRYYFIDFGISSMFKPEDKEKKVLGLEGQDHDVPELSLVEPYDPFLADVYILGHLFEAAFIDRYDNLAFLRSLVEDMMQSAPLLRSNAERALNDFNNLISRQSPRSLRWRLKKKTYGQAERFFADVDSISHEGVFLARRAITSSTSNVVRFLQKHLRLDRKG
ncbi:hypothetical protein A7U60_g346 [Sanghuangporus baumii]|uniref:Protein kinase domain-containing protein n=1 Tax=Sanghuangporus baumii TaxID=108892 RepID=A0A9Q5NFE3_SANBA|nr:hypothetical protein A7U60_g346 [Sanghuangporus baumii]